MFTIAHDVRYRLIACTIPIVLAIVLACGTSAVTVTVSDPTPANLRFEIFIGNLPAQREAPQAPGTTHIRVRFSRASSGGIVVPQGISLTCNHITLQLDSIEYEADVPTPAFAEGYTFAYQAKGQSTSVTIPTLQPVLISPANRSHLSFSPNSSRNIPVTYRIDGSIPSRNPSVDLRFEGTGGYGLVVRETRLIFDYLPPMSQTTLTVYLPPGGTTDGTISFNGTFTGMVNTPSAFGEVSVEYQFATNVNVVWEWQH